MCAQNALPATGTVIVLYGTPCSGKSTLAKQLIKDLPGDFHIVKKTKRAFQKRKSFLAKEMGQHVETYQQATELMHLLPKEKQAMFAVTSREALMETLEEIQLRAAQGENIIFDVCLDDTSKLSPQMVKILVYSPLGLLSERDNQRTLAKRQSFVFQQHRRNAILGLFKKLYRTADDQTSASFTLSRYDLEKFLEESPLKESIEREIQVAKKTFGLSQKEFVEIVPVIKPDLIIPTNLKSVEKSSLKIRAFLNLSLQSLNN